MKINWKSLMYIVLLVGSEIWTVRQPIVEDVIHRIIDALWGFASRGLGRLWRLIAAPAPVLLDQGQAVPELQKIQEELKTRIKRVEAENEVLREKNGAMEKQVVDLQKIEEELKTQIKELETENEVLREKNGATEKKVVDLQKIEEDLKTKVKEVEAENRMLSRRNQKMQKKVIDLQKIEKELKTKIEEAGAENKVLRENNGAMEKKVADLQKIKEELKTKIKGTTGTENKVLREKSEATEIMSKIIGEGWIHRGPWGGNGGAYWTYKVDVAPILQITLGWGSVIDSILIKSKSCDGNIIGNFQRIGGPGGHNFVTFRINNSVERLSSISLTYGHYRGEQTIASLCFYSNLDTYGPFGSVRDPDDPSVSIPIEDDVVLAGFHGRAGNFLNAFGVLVAPKVLNSSHKASGSMLHLEELR
ncbi:uncharacterized protein LOC131311345 isoform X1 [Rhododendron vialii]|uniref:uncharacterized protein LOC131311345 isoform X1 n=1 Tax=Rhododendron vialii TaxID=182163 RepID=UPI00265E34EE|nr:uncharacterized protein LOC131311345 isoform X1 [Rhododendron vialii]